MIELVALQFMIETGDQRKPWFVAILMVVSIVIIIALTILGHASRTTENSEEKWENQDEQKANLEIDDIEEYALEKEDKKQ